MTKECDCKEKIANIEISIRNMEENIAIIVKDMVSVKSMKSAIKDNDHEMQYTDNKESPNKRECATIVQDLLVQSTEMPSGDHKILENIVMMPSSDKSLPANTDKVPPNEDQLGDNRKKMSSSKSTSSVKPDISPNNKSFSDEEKTVTSIDTKEPNNCIMYNVPTKNRFSPFLDNRNDSENNKPENTSEIRTHDPGTNKEKVPSTQKKKVEEIWFRGENDELSNMYRHTHCRGKCQIHVFGHSFFFV